MTILTTTKNKFSSIKIIFILFSFILQSLISQSTVLNDGFSTFNRDRWSVADKENISVGSGSIILNKCTIFGGSPNWEDYELELRAKTPSSAREVHLFASVRCQDETTRYIVGLRGGNNNDLYLARIGSGNKHAVLSITPLDFIPQKNTWYKLRVLAQGKEFRVYLGDESVPRIAVTDQSAHFSSGGVGLGGGWEPMEFDYVKVILKPAYEPGSSTTRINFQDTVNLDPVPGWQSCDNRSYSAARGWGWLNSAGVYDRKRGVSDDPLYDTVVGFNQKEGIYPVTRTFVLDIQDGDYIISLQMGDPKYNSRNRIYLMNETAPSLDDKCEKGSYSLVRRSINVSGGQLRITFEQPDSSEGWTINWMTAEPRAAAGELAWTQYDNPPTDNSSVVAARKAANRAAYAKKRISSIAGTRQTYSLNGDWLFLPEQEFSTSPQPWAVNADDSQWHVLGVPNFWTPMYNWSYFPDHEGRGSPNWVQRERERCNNYTFDWKATRSGYYRHCVRLPAGIEDKTVLIKFLAIAMCSRIYVNGSLAAVHQGMFSPVSVDISKHIKAGDNFIVVHAGEMVDATSTDPAVAGSDSTWQLTNTDYPFIPHGIFGTMRRGIWQDVSLTVTGKTYIEDSFFKPQENDYSLEVSLKNSGSTRADYSLASQLRSVEDNRLIYDYYNESRKMGLSTAGGAAAIHNLSCKDSQHLPFAKWTPEFPNLYKVDIFAYTYKSTGSVNLESFAGSATRLNFQSLSDAGVAGWTAVGGQLYDGSGYGWSDVMDSRDRNGSTTSEQLYNTLLQPRKGKQCTFTYDLANGDYVITIQFGDPSYPTLAEAHVGNNANSIESAILRDILPKGERVIALKSLNISGGKLQITIPRMPEGGRATAVNWLVIEKRSAVSTAKWNLGKEHFTILDNVSYNVGFRSFATAGDDFLLNSIPYKIRGANHSPNIIRPNDAPLADFFMKAAHDNNINFTRTHGAPMNSTWLEACDRHGVAVSLEGTWPWLMHFGDRNEIPSEALRNIWLKDWLGVIDELKNHPSILMYTMNNEMKMDVVNHSECWEILSDAIAEVRAMDNTRVLCADSGFSTHKLENETPDLDALVAAGIDMGDIDDNHFYPNWYEEQETFFNIRSPEHTRFIEHRTPGRPFISQEFSMGYPDADTGHSVKHYIYKHMVTQSLVGKWAYEHYDPSYYLKRHALLVKELGEAIRTGHRDTSAGVMLFAMVSWFKNVYDASTISPYPAMEAARKAWEPVLVSAQLMGRHFFTGTSHTVNTVIVNDSPTQETLSDIRVDWNISYGGAVLRSGAKNLAGSLSYYSNRSSSLTFSLPGSIPSQKIEASLNLVLKANGRTISRNDYDITMANADYSKNADGARIGLYTHNDQLTSILENKLDTAVTRIDNLGRLGDYSFDVLLVANLAGRPADYDQVLSFAQNGGKVLLYRNGDHVEDLLPGEISGSTRLSREIVTPLAFGSPVFGGIEPDELCWFTGSENDSASFHPGLTPIACTRAYSVKDAAHIKLLAETTATHGYYNAEKNEYNNAGTYDETHAFPMIEISKGEGTIIVSSIFMEAGDDPIAVKLLANTIEYLAAGSDPKPTPTPNPGTTYQAENWSGVNDCKAAQNNTGFEGDAFVDMGGTGAWFELSGISGSGSEADISIRYALAEGKPPRSCELLANGSKQATIAFTGSGTWSTWQTKTVRIPLGANGNNKIRFSALAGGGPNIDLIRVSTGPVVTPTPTPLPKTIYQAENWSGVLDCKSAQNNTGYHGDAFVDMGGSGSWFEVSGISGSGSETDITIRFALSGGAAPRPCDLLINGSKKATVNFTGSGTWTTWQSVTINAVLASGGNNKLRLLALGGGGPNVDEFAIGTATEITPTPTPTPTATPTPQLSIPTVGMTITLRAVNGKLVSANNAGSVLIANASTAGNYEKFEIIPGRGDTIALKCLGNGKVVCGDKAGSMPLAAIRPAAGGWESYTVIQKGDKIGFLALANSLYVSAPRRGADALVASKEEMRSYESFSWEQEK